jgi:AcrR family transcriptional regulator
MANIRPPRGAVKFRYTLCSVISRKYELKQRAESMAETRRRITEATVALHREVGPAHTTVSEIARRAGVGRLTVYNHFPDDAQLFAACQAHFLADNPPPDVFALAKEPDPDARLGAVLEALYGWYRGNQAMVGNIDRDAPAIPALRELVESTNGAMRSALADQLMRGRGLRGRRARRTRAAIALALEFRTWFALAVNGGLEDDEAAAVAAGVVRAAAVDR